LSWQLDTIARLSRFLVSAIKKRDEALAQATPQDPRLSQIYGLILNPPLSKPMAISVVITQTELYLAKICDTQALKDARDKLSLQPSAADVVSALAELAIDA